MTQTVDVAVIGLGALGSATTYALARAGRDVLGVERFELGHIRGASHGESRILRRSYHTPAYVRLAGEAYDDWAQLEADSGERLVTVTGGIDLFPPGAAIGMDDYVESMSAVGVPFEVLDADAVRSRWPQFVLPAGTVALHQADTAIVPPSRATTVLQRRARAYGAHLRDRCSATILRSLGDEGAVLDVGGSTITARRVVVTADAWTNNVLRPLGVILPLTVTREQVTHLSPPDPETFEVGRLPIWIWMDDPSYYGFPSFGEPTVKVAQDCGGAVVDPHTRHFDPDLGMASRLAAFTEALLPDVGSRVERSSTCLYTLTPDRDFVLGALPQHPAVIVGLGAAHGFKFAPTFGRLLAELAVTGTTTTDVSAFAVDRPALTDPSHRVSWLV